MTIRQKNDVDVPKPSTKKKPLKKLDLEKYAPAGFPLKTEIKAFIILLVFSYCYSIGIWGRIRSALNSLYTYEFGNRVLMPNGLMPLYDTLIQNGFFGFYLLIFLSVIAAFYHYHYHSQGSKSIYLMRRLPKSSELPKRCLTLPCMGILICILSILMLRLYYFGLYYIYTPKNCLPPVYTSALWQVYSSFL